MTALVTGASGFVGAAVVRALLARGEAVRALVRATSDRRNLDGLEVELAEGDLRDRGSLERAAKGCSALYHVVADYRIWVPDADSMFAANVEGSRNVLRAAAEAGATRMVYTSSVAVLGNPGDGRPGDEATPVTFADMTGTYKQSKYRAEEAVKALIADENLPVVIVNPSTPIGPRDVRPTPTGRVIVEAAAGRMPAFVDTGLNVVHVDDVAAGHLLAFDRGEIGERYVLGGDDMSLQEMLRVVAEHVGRKPPTVSLPHGLVMPLAVMAEAWTRLRGRGEPFATVDGIRMARKKMFFSSAKAERDLGYVHRPGSEAITAAIDWFRDQGYLD